MEKTFRVEKSTRLDIFLANETSKSRSYIKKLIKEGKVSVKNIIVVKPSFLLENGDLIKIQELEPKKLHLQSENKPLEIVYEDDYLLIINKEAGLMVHPVGSKTEGTLVNRLLFHIKNLSNIGGVLRPGIVHRLDKDTSGLMVVAKTEEAHIKLSEMLKEHKIKRKYLALVKGKIKEKNGTINLPIKRKSGETKMTISAFGRRAVTHYKKLDEIGPFTLLEIKLETGRTHQIRTHLSYIGHPIVGDLVYGGKTKELPLKRQFLHSYEISFNHPIIEKEIKAFSMLTFDLLNTLHILREQWKKIK
jgi:23S rRNA pseudouridine1911/1915/1917 synthase